MKNKYLYLSLVAATLALLSIAVSGCSKSTDPAPVTTNQPSIKILSPGLNETIASGKLNYQISWTGTGIATQKTIEYSLDNGSTWILIGVLNADVTTYSWNVPNVISSGAIVRITDKNALRASSGAFKITFPDGGLNATISGFGSFIAKDAHVTNGAVTYSIRASMPSSKPSLDSVIITIVAAKQGATPYTINVATDPNSLMDYCIVNPSGTCNNYRVQPGKGSGTLTITSLTPNIEGTFSGTFASLNGSGTVTIANGVFNATF